MHEARGRVQSRGLLCQGAVRVACCGMRDDGFGMGLHEEIMNGAALRGHGVARKE